METVCQSLNSFDKPAKQDAIDTLDTRSQPQSHEGQDKKAAVAVTNPAPAPLDAKQGALSSSRSPTAQSNTIQDVKVKRCKHGRIIFKDRSKRKQNNEQQMAHRDRLKDSGAGEQSHQALNELLAEPHASITMIDGSSPYPSNETTSTSTHAGSKVALNLHTDNNMSNNNNDSNHISHELTAGPASGKESPSHVLPEHNPQDSMLHQSESASIAFVNSKTSRTSEDISRGRDNHTPRRDNLRPRSHRSKSPRTRDKSRSPRSRHASKHRDRRKLSPIARRNNRCSPDESRCRRYSPRSRSPHRTRRTKSRSRSRESKRVYSQSRHPTSRSRPYANSPERDHRRQDKSRPDSDKHSRTRDSNNRGLGNVVGKHTIKSASSATQLPGRLDSGNSSMKTLSARVVEQASTQDRFSAQDQRQHLQPIDQSVPENHTMDSKNPVCPESSPYRTISANSSMVLSSEESDGGGADDVNSISSDIYDPEGPIMSISSGDSPPISPLQTASNPPPPLPTLGDKIDDDMPSSAVQLNQQEKYLQKLNRQERVVEEVKLALRPHYQRRFISKEQYKDVLRRAVPKVSYL